MVPFEDRMLLSFLKDDFVGDLLKNKLGLRSLFDTIYETEEIEIKKIESVTVRSRQFQRPAFETIRITGTEEHLRQPLQRVKVDYSRRRSGRLEWIDVFFEISLSAKIHDKQAPIKSIKTRVDKKDISIEFKGKTPQPYDPNDPQNVRTFSVNVCIRLQSELDILASVRNAKLCRSILENHRDSAENFEGGQINTPYAFAVIFPDDVVANDSIPGLNAQQAKAAIKDLFASERMIAHFYKEP
jgi:hypothetical protein